MCYVVERNELPRIAEEDILVYKNTLEWHRKPDQGFESLYREYRYYPNDEHPKVALELEEPEHLMNTSTKFINKGYHSYTKDINDKHLVDYIRFVSAEFIIPKGTKYYHNGCEYVSETIKMKGWIT